MKKTYYVKFSDGVCRVFIKDKEQTGMRIVKGPTTGRYYLFDYNMGKYLSGTEGRLELAVSRACDYLSGTISASAYFL